MTYLSVFFLILFCGLLLLLSFRPGNPIFDMIRLPRHLKKVKRAHPPTRDIQRIPYGPHRAQYLLYVAPGEDSAPHQPAIFFLHGGGWQFGHPRMFIHHGQVIAAAGYPVYLLCHRKIPWAGAAAIQQDVDEGFKTVLRDLAARGSTGRKVVFWGMSSGGNLGSLLFLDSQRLARLGCSAARLAGGLFMAAPLDLDQMWFSPPLRTFAGRRRGTKYQTVNPILFIRPEDQRPILIIHSVQDGIVEISNATTFFRQRLQYAPQATQMIVLPRGIHFDPASWVYEDGKVRSYIFDWLRKLWEPQADC
jgi:acetyl esterase/lipase